MGQVVLRPIECTYVTMLIDQGSSPQSPPQRGSVLIVGTVLAAGVFSLSLPFSLNLSLSLMLWR